MRLFSCFFPCILFSHFQHHIEDSLHVKFKPCIRLQFLIMKLPAKQPVTSSAHQVLILDTVVNV